MGVTSFWDTLVQNITGKPKGDLPEAYAAIYPLYEVQTPQYPTPNPYSIAQAGYRTNELIYSCITKRSTAIAEAPMWVYDDSGETPEELDNHGLRELLRAPCERLSEEQFWQITEIYLCIAGFAAWEKERNNLGEVIALWPMRPDWCSFYRGEGRPLRAVRYQPYGLPPADIDIDNVVLFQYFDPLFPLLKGFSPSMAALRQMGIDNDATNFLKVFFQEGAAVNGLLKTTQALSDAEAQRIQARWTQQHGGSSNWSKVAVLGSGVEYQQTSMNFKDMEFGDLDARSESRICSIFQVPPILVGAKVGLDRSTFSNFAEARLSFYEETITPEWRFLSSVVREQLLPDFEQDTARFYPAFYTKNIKAMQEDVNLQWQRAMAAATAGIITRDEAREVMGYDPIDEVPVFVGASAPAVGDESVPGETPEQLVPFTGEIPDTQQEPVEPEEPEGTDAEQELEEKRFRSFAGKRLKEGHPERVLNFAWQYTPSWKKAILLAEVGAVPAAPFQGIITQGEAQDGA